MTEHRQSAPTGEESPLSRCYAVILAGGSGTRLWPLSRTMLPKQLLALNGDLTLLQQTVDRSLAVFGPERLRVVTNEEHVFQVRNQLKELADNLERQVLSEPLGKNTLPAILLGMDSIVDADPDAVVAVFPSDHLIHNLDRWADALERGSQLAAQGWFVTFGVTPTHPETGYGYIARGASLGGNAFQVEGFVEKPDLARAQRFLEDGTHFWNSGMFVFPAKAFLQAVDQFQPDIAAWWAGRDSRPLADGYRTIPNISVDYGIMEHASPIAMVAADFGWDDLGSWEAVYRLGSKDQGGCVVQGSVLALDCADSLLLSKGGMLAAVGMKNIIAVQTRDATLLCPLDQVQRVKEVVARLKAEGSPLVESHVTVKRPWGSYTVLDSGRFYKVKRIEVAPGARLSLQMHHHRSEHWVVIAGTALVQIGEQETLLTENQTADIPKATKHRLSNPGKVPLEIIEIQSGPYLEEDDIVRFDDVYGRKA